MSIHPEESKNDDIDVPARIIHLGLLVFGLPAFITGGWAEDYEYARHLGFTVHRLLGMALAFFVCLRLIYGLVGPTTVRFSQWVPYKKERLGAVWEDVKTLLTLHMGYELFTNQ